MSRLLVVAAVAAERDAVLAGLGTLGKAVPWPGPGSPTAPGPALVDVVAAGVGPAAAAACTGALLATAAAAGRPYAGVASLGICGGFAGRAGVGTTVIGTRSVAADLGADSPDGFVALGALGFGTDTLDADATLVDRLRAALPAGAAGAVLTVSTVTGTTERTAELRERHPDAAGEAMEGFGVATAAAAYGVPFVEVRTVSNLVGPRDRGAWRIPEALTALAGAARALGTLVG